MAHPSNQLIVVPGHSAIFHVTVEAIPSHGHTYQWKKNRSDIPRATSGSLTIFSVEKADEGIYFCVVSNAAGPVTSDPAELTVCKSDNVLVHLLTNKYNLSSPSLYCVSLPPLPQPLQFSSAVTPPIITVQPTDQSMVVPGSSSMFSVSVKVILGHDHTYQWQKNTTNISEATSSTLTISGVTKTDDEAIYICIVSNAAGAVTSYPAKLTVCKSNAIVCL